MAARKSRTTSAKPAPSGDSRFEVLLEDLNDKFRVFGEALETTRASLTRRMDEGFADVNQRLDSMQRAIWSLEQRVSAVERRMGALEAAVTHHSEEIRELRAALSRKPDIDDLRRLEARVAELEKRVGVH